MQSVNLYTHEFRPVKTVLPLAQIVVFNALLVLVLIAFTAWMQIEADNLQDQVTQTQNGLDRVKEQETDLQQQLESQRLDESLQRHRDRLTKQIEAREDLLSTLESAVIDDFSGFSPYFVGLARQVPQSLWLSKIVLAENGNRMELEGMASDADSVPGYLSVLQEEPVFVGRSFSVFDVNRAEGSRELFFRLQSKAVEQSQVIIANSADGRTTAERMIERASTVNGGGLAQ